MDGSMFLFLKHIASSVRMASRAESQMDSATAT